MIAREESSREYRGVSPGPEKQEIPEQPPIVLIVRENEQFEHEIPAFVHALQSLGRKVGAHSFPRGSGKDEIEQWAKENPEFFEGKIVLSDYTSARWLDSGVLERALEKKTGYLDEKFQYAAYRAISAERPELDEDSYEAFEKLVKYVIREGLSRGRMPERVVVVKNMLDHHVPIPERFEIEDPRSVDKEKLATIFAEQDEWVEQLRESFADTFRSWLIDAGVPQERISVVQDIIDEEAMSQRHTEELKWKEERLERTSDEATRRKIQSEIQTSQENERRVLDELKTGKSIRVEEANMPGTWIFFDQHWRQEPAWGRMEGDARAMHLMLPGHDLLQNAAVEGLIEYDRKRFEEELAKIAKKDFGGEQ